MSSVVANSLRGAATTGLKWVVEDASRTVVPSVTNGGTPVVGSYDATTNKAVVTADDYAADIVLTTASGETAARTVKVTAWYDDNNNGTIDADEYEASQTVNFLAASSVTSSVVVTSPIIGDTSFEGYIVTSPVLNFAQSTAPTVSTSWQGNSNAFAATVSQDSTNKRFKFVAERSNAIASGTIASTTATLTTNAHKLAVGEKVTIAGVTASTGTAAGVNGTKTISAVATNTYDVAAGGATGTISVSSATAKVQIVAGSYSATPSVGSQEGTKASFTVGAAVADDSTATTAAGANVKVTGNDTDTVAAAVRYTTKAVSATFAFVDADDKAVAAGKPVRVTVAITSATGVTLNGSTKTDGQTLDVVTDASGKATISVATTSGDASDVIALTAVAEGVSTTSSTVTFTWTATTLGLYDLANAKTGLVRSIAVGGSHTFKLAVTDNWGQAVSGAYRFKVATSGNTVSENYYDAPAGTASVTVADAKIGSSNVSVVVTPQKKNDSGTWEDSTANSALPAAVTYTLIPTAQTNGAVTVPAAQSASPSTATLVAGDTRTSQAAITAVSAAPITIDGVVSDATTGVVKPGALVTVSGPSTMLFTNDTVAAFGSISFYADATTGAYSVDVTSNVSQKESVVTVTSLGGSKTVKVTFTAAAETAGSAISFVAPKIAKTGRTLSMTVKLVDKFGNAVNGGDTASGGSQIELSYEGPGFVVSDLSAVTELGTDGEYTVRVLLGSDEAGKGTLSLKYDPSGDDLTSTDVISSSVDVLVGVSATVAAGKKSASTTVKNASGLTIKVVSGSKSVTKVATSDSYKVSLTKLTAGKKTVKVYVNNVLVTSKSVSVK
jgi:hypothetical protein